ncbi:hypothetical protein [Bryocella elongata]|nr:hypothetical protein [Bryocella elongata]
MSKGVSSAQRKGLLIIGSVVAMSGVAASLGQKFPLVVWLYGAYLLCAFGYVVVQLVKVKRLQKRRKSLSAATGRGGRA